ncbi:aldehyde dehydrogenase family protein [Paenarthrobacter aromaticivorans]|uniref:Aldehyde dehydrogenase family protein n=1 Tax=Paenarthrobacter aromaticivorans TaxID=2849150 RepID=A0ABS6ICD2_9MICC|nr:aldehyde dehydrogenase family protein [Paenarthrobacter sp. MMS21-TAE1-1]MBU8868523.1 aldehyde dehydrogenase family protein [Paenarthrobacter sp. MMS21-TAE1-1]
MTDILPVAPSDAGTLGPPRDWSLFIGNKFVPSAGKRIPVINPATGEQIGTIADATAEDVDHAVEVARSAQVSWARKAPRARANLLLQVAQVLEAHAEELALIDSVDNGSTLRMMRGDIALGIRQIRYLAGLTTELKGQSIPTDERDSLDFTIHQPFGVVGRIVPFNHPFMFAASKVVVPLATGNTVILKPSAETSLSALRFAELAAQVLPPGVLNVLTGRGSHAGDLLVRHPDVPRIAFTGSVEVGLQIQRSAATNRAKVVTLELGGKNPLIVFADADLDAAVGGAVRGMNFTWQGQSCGSTSRVYVHRSLWSSFIERMGRQLEAMQVGDPLDPASDVGAIVSRKQYDSVRGFLEEGLADPNARLVTGGLEDRPSVGTFIRPTLFAFDGGGSRSRLVNEEIFGPIVVAMPFDDYDEVIEEANRLDVGLTASVWTTSLATAMAATRDLQAGYVWVNHSGQHLPGAPFGGMKDSGIGREESLEEFYSYAQQKNVYINYSESGARK